MRIVWWYWVCVGLFLLLAEAMTPGGFYLFFIGIAALVVGVVALGVETAWVQLALFAVLSTVLIVTLRKPVVGRVRESTRQADTPEFIGETARTVGQIAAGGEGRVELRGSIWQAHNRGSVDLAANAPCTVVARDGLKIVVTPKA